MYKVRLLKAIEQKKAELEKLLKKEDPKLSYLNKFSEKYDISSIDGIASIAKGDLFSAFLLASDDQYTVDELSSFVVYNMLFIEMATDNEVANILGRIQTMKEVNVFDKIKTLLAEKDIIKITEENALYPEHIHLYDLFMTLDRIFGENNYDIDTLISLAEKDVMNIVEAKSLLTTISAVRTIISVEKRAVELEESAGKKISEKEKSRRKLEQIERVYNIKKIKNRINDINKYHVKLASIDKKEKNKLQKEIAAYNELEEKLFLALEKGEVTAVKTLISKIPDESIRLEVLKTIYKHNSKLYENLQEEYDKLNFSSSSKYQVALADKGIPADKYDVTTIMDKSIEELEEMIDKIKGIGITGQNLIITILQNSTLDIVNEVIKMADKANLSSGVIAKHPQLFIPNSTIFQNAVSNIDLFNKEGLNIHYLRGSQNIFFIETTILKTNIDILKEYSLTTSLKTGINCNFLQDEKLAESIDQLLELGYEKSLEESLEILNYKNNFERLRLLKELNIPVSSTEELINILSSDKFLMPDEDISSYIYNAVTHKQPIVTQGENKSANLLELDQYSNTSRTYSFDGVLISKNKTKRNILTVSKETNKEERLIYALTKDSILSDEEFEKVETAIRKTANKQIKKVQ